MLLSGNVDWSQSCRFKYWSHLAMSMSPVFMSLFKSLIPGAIEKNLVSSLMLSHVYSVYGLHFNCWKNGEAILRNQNYLKLILWLYFSRMCMNSCMEFAFERNKSVVTVFWESPTGCLIYYYVWALSMRHVQILLIIPDLLKYYYCVSLSLRAAWALLWVRNLVEVYAFNICGSVSACLDYFWCRYWLQYDLLWNV